MSTEEVAKYQLPPNRKFKSKTAHVFPGGFASSQSRTNDRFCLEAIALSSQVRVANTRGLLHDMTFASMIDTTTYIFSDRIHEGIS